MRLMRRLRNWWYGADELPKGSWVFYESVNAIAEIRELRERLNADQDEFARKVAHHLFSLLLECRLQPPPHQSATSREQPTRGEHRTNRSPSG